MDTPVPVTVFTQDKLTEYGINNYIDLSQMVPMLEITDSNNHGAPVITMRGVRSLVTDKELVYILHVHSHAN